MTCATQFIRSHSRHLKILESENSNKTARMHWLRSQVKSSDHTAHESSLHLAEIKVIIIIIYNSAELLLKRLHKQHFPVVKISIAVVSDSEWIQPRIFYSCRT